MVTRNILSQIGDKVRQESLSAKDSLAKLFDPTMQHYQSYVGYPREQSMAASKQPEMSFKVDMDRGR